MSKTIYLINHSHTDIGYTDVQEIITEYHVDYIRQAMEIISIELEKYDSCDYVWTCENYWQVDLFLNEAEPAEIAVFEEYIAAGYIDFGKNYLNMTELVDSKMYAKYLKEGDDYSKKFNRQLNSAMTADINGYSWSYSDSLLDNGVDNLFACVHGHHGIYPLFKNQLPFWWESPKGEKLLVWSGEHYHFGNELAISPLAQTSYQIKDEFVNDYTTDQFEIATKRIFRYIEDLTNRGYTYDFIPLMISGFISDNAGPNEDLLTFIHRWNESFGDQITLKMSGLNEFFNVLRKEDLSVLPTYTGDWNDWWADGVGSTPAATKIYKEAIRKYRLLQELTDGKTGELSDKEQINLTNAEKNLLMYAEHTWGYSSSVSEPWNTLVNELDYRKVAYATNGSQQITKVLNTEVVSKYGRSYPKANRQQKYKVINPYGESISSDSTLLIEYWENIEGRRITPELFPFIEVYDVDTNEVYPCQIDTTARAFEVVINIALAPKEIKTLSVRLTQEPKLKLNYTTFVQGAEGVLDIVFEGKPNDYFIETEHFTVELSNRTGIKDIILKSNNQSILKEDYDVPAFLGVYEKTEIRTSPYEERRRMGRNRKGKHADRSISKIRDVYVKERGEIFTTVVIEGQLEGTKMYAIYLKIYNALPKIEASIRIQKNNEWAPENLYVSLPFSIGEELFVKKSGNVMRPKVDQLPGTNTEFYLLDTGNMYIDETNKRGLGVCMHDTPLITLGDLENHPIELFRPSDKSNNENVYSWVMNNFWETNFKVDLSGFYEFKYTVFVSEDISNIQELDKKMDQTNQGIITIPI